MESFWASLKTECVYRYTFPTRAEAKTIIFAYLEAFYIRQRLHSTLGYLSPDHFEQTLLPSSTVHHFGARSVSFPSVERP
jgi:putative transposase